MVKRAAFVASFLIGSALVFSTVAGALSQRNPFRVPDIVAPDGPDIMHLATQVRMGGGPDDRNAPQWSQSIAEAAHLGERLVRASVGFGTQELIGSPGWIRTSDHSINSRMLYR